MAAWTIKIEYFDPSNRKDDELSLGMNLNFYYTQGEVIDKDVLAPFRDPEEIDRLMLPENYKEWRDAVSLAVAAVLYGEEPPAAEINGERIDMPEVADDDGKHWVDAIDDQWYELIAGKES